MADFYDEMIRFNRSQIVACMMMEEALGTSLETAIQYREAQIEKLEAARKLASERGKDA